MSTRYFFWTAKPRHIILFKKICNVAESSWNLLINIKKTTVLLAAHKNSNCYCYKYEKKKKKHTAVL